MKTPSTITARIDSLDSKGKGIALNDKGKPIAIPYTIPGEVVEAEKLRRGQGRLLKIQEPSPHRVDPICAHFLRCGGCAWQHIEYQHQLRFKQERISKLFHQVNLPLNVESLPIVPSSHFGYRNRMDYVWWYDGRLGLRQAGKWHAVEDLRECHLLPPETMSVVFELKRRALDMKLPLRDQKKTIRGLRYFIIRRGVFTGNLMLNIVSDDMRIPPQLWEGIPQLTSVYQLVNTDIQSHISDGEPVHLAGEDTYRERILDHTFHVGPRSFFQPNPQVAQEMVLHVRSLLSTIPSSKGLLDLYCGIGLFTVLLSDIFERTLGIEVNEEAIALARTNAEGSNAEFLRASAESLDTSSWEGMDTLLLDPPRSGAMPAVLQAIRQHPFKDIFYVSCNPNCGIRDIVLLQEEYALLSVKLFDQFPQTPHVEMIAHLRRKP